MLAFEPLNGALVSLISTLLVSFRSRPALQAEILALRHQWNILQRSSRKRTRPRTTDRILGVCMSKLWSDWRSALWIVKPETVIRWHRQGFRFFVGGKVVARDDRMLDEKSEISSGKCAPLILPGEHPGAGD